MAPRVQPPPAMQDDAFVSIPDDQLARVNGGFLGDLYGLGWVIYHDLWKGDGHGPSDRKRRRRRRDSDVNAG